MSRSSKLIIQLSQQELIVVVEALTSFPITESEQVQPYLRALNAFRKATASQPFEATLENLEAVSQALVSHRDRALPAERDAVESIEAKIASSLAPSGVSVGGPASGVFISRHPIFGSNLDTLGYELRTQRKKADGSVAGFLVVAQTILDRFTEEGLDQLVGNRPAFIGMSQAAIEGGYCESLPKQRTILEVLEGANPDQHLFEALAELSRLGHRIAIADSLIRRIDYPLASIANVIKLDFADLGKPAIASRLETLKEVKSKFLADHVETHDDFEFAHAMGFDYFRGYFFCKPHITGTDIPVNRLATMRLLARLRDPGIDAQELGELISQDVALAFKLLEFANSAYAGLSGKIESINHGVSLVGIERIRTWASLLMFSKMEDTPRELMITAITRAKMCENLAEASNRAQQAAFFTVGLFSVLDAVLDCPMPQALDLLPLSDEICQALLYRKGALGEALKCVLAYEQSDWQGVQHSYLTGVQIGDCYLDSLGWTGEHSDGLRI